MADAVNVSEATLQKGIVDWLNNVLIPPAFVMSVANKPRSKIAGAQEKAMGAKKGFPDLIVFHPERHVAMEVKREGQYARPEQREMLARLNDCGLHTSIVRSIEDARETLERAGIKTREA